MTRHSSPTYDRAYYLEHRTEKIEAMKKWNREHPESVARSKRKSRYGITESQYQTLFLIQCGKCFLCTEVLEKPHIDHDHTTGRVRGLLCHQCNRGLGLLKEDPELLRAASDYLWESR